MATPMVSSRFGDPVQNPPQPILIARAPLEGAPATVVPLAGAYAIAGGALTLCGWALGIRRLTDWADGGISMFVNTAICAVFGGVALFALRKQTLPRDWIARAAAGLMALLGGLTLSEHLFGWDLGLDTLLWARPWGLRAATAPMRMGPPASTSFLILGIALLIATWGSRQRRWASALAILPLAIASLSLTGYWFGADQLFGVARFTGIALQTSTILAALGVGAMAAVPEHGVVAVLRRNDAGGALLRRLIIPIVTVPLVLGWLRIVGQNAGLYDTAFGTALRTLIEVVLLFALLWWTSVSISQHAHAAHEAQAQLAAIVESSDDAVVSKSLDGAIQSWNAGAERLFGYTQREALDQHVSLIIPSERLEEDAQILARIQRGERIDHYETVRKRKDGSWLNVSLTVSPVRDSSGRIVGVSKIARDITERKRADQAILEAERAARSEAERVNIMKDEFLATLSHELRTPLNAILGWSQLLGTGKLESADTQQGLEAIERNARAQTQLIDDLLDMSRIISGKVRLDVQWTDLAAVVELAVDSVRPSAEAKQIRLRKILDPHAGPVSGDPTRLQQIVWNLLTNAIKFTPKGGKVDVLLERVNSHIEITVHDSGIGIEPAFLPHVFERFRQGDSSISRPYGGLGLGLSIVKNLVELHGGSVRAQSDGPGQGATFIVSLPIAPVRDDQKREHPTTPKPAPLDCDQFELSGIKVLVVDDEPDARALITRVLNQCRANVVVARNAEEGIDLLRTEKPHVVISDIGMPDKDGYQFMREVRSLSTDDGGKTPAIALTAFARSEDRTRAVMAGYQVHIAKPIEPQELLATVASLAGRMG